MKIRLAKKYDTWRISRETYLKLSGKSSESICCESIKTYAFNGSWGTYHIPKHFVGKIIK